MSRGRNDPCPCGSGKKHKKCCLPRDESASIAETGWLRMRRTEGELVEKMIVHVDRYYGPGALQEAWDEYLLWPDAPAAHDEWPESDTSFPPWMLFDWEPEQCWESEHVQRPAIPPARHFARRKGTRLDSYELRFIEAASEEPFTFYLVLAPVPGREIKLRDIFRQNEVTVRERQASTMLRPGDIVFTKVVRMDGQAIMLGCAPYPIPSRYFDAIVTFRERIARDRDLDAEVLDDYRIELRGLYLELREDILDPALPTLQNTDGEPFELTRVEYRLECSPQDAFTALLPLTLEDDPDAFEDECERDRSGTLLAVRFPWIKEGNAQHSEWTSTVLGHIEVRGDRMSVEVNSRSRSETIQEEIATRLGERAVLIGNVIESVEQQLAGRAVEGKSSSRSVRRSEFEELQRSPEVQAMLTHMNAEHWRTWPDTPLPALRGATPRQAAKTPGGRELLEVLLLDFSARDDTSTVMRPDVAALRRELGL